MLKTILLEDLGHKVVNYDNVNKERMSKVREMNTYKKWSKENIHLFVWFYESQFPQFLLTQKATKYLQHYRISKKMWDLNVTLKKMRGQLNEIASTDDSMYPDSSSVQLESYLIVTVRKLITTAITDEEVMEVRMILSISNL
jgi:hypothetical protein